MTEYSWCDEPHLLWPLITEPLSLSSRESWTVVTGLELVRPLSHLSSLLDNKNNEDDCSALTVQEGEEQEPNTYKN